MTLDPKKIREIARVCATLSKSAPTAEEHDIFANLASKWLSIALDRETRRAIDLDRFDDDGGHQVSVSPQKAQVARRSPLGMAIGKQNARERLGFEPTVRLPVQRFSSSKVRMVVASVLVRRPAMVESPPTERPQAANDREMESRDRKMHENTS